jgi:hemolysin activation/secretion protein
MQNRLEFINRNPFRRVDLVYSPGKEKNTTDIELLVEDRRPYRFFTGTDNTGVETTGRGRYLAGFNAAKIGSLDHFLTYQYTSSYDFSQFQANTLQYIAYLPWRHVLTVYGGNSTVHADLPFPTMQNHGHSYQASARYVIPLGAYSSFAHECGFGFDFKRTNNTITFSEVFPIVGPNVNLSQFTVRYSGNIAKSRFRFDFDGELFFSPGPMLGDETDRSYATLRPAAKNHWIYGKAYAKYFQKLPHQFSLYLLGRGQLSSQNLLPSEQVGLGGFDTVRGYDERQLNYDSGAIINAEIHCPSFSVTCKKDALQFLAFIDYGMGGNHTPIPGEKKYDYLLGTGPALRYTLNPWLVTRVDFGIKLHKEKSFTGGNTVWHFSFIGSF